MSLPWPAFIQLSLVVAVLVGLVLVLVLWFSAQLVNAKSQAALELRKLYEDRIGQAAKQDDFFREAYDRLSSDTTNIIETLHKTVSTTIAQNTEQGRRQSEMTADAISKLITITSNNNLQSLHLVAQAHNPNIQIPEPETADPPENGEPTQEFRPTIPSTLVGVNS